jgi:hypothetical protein
MDLKFGSRGVCPAAPHATPHDHICLVGHVACGGSIIVPILCDFTHWHLPANSVAICRLDQYQD